MCTKCEACKPPLTVLGIRHGFKNFSDFGKASVYGLRGYDGRGELVTRTHNKITNAEYRQFDSIVFNKRLFGESLINDTPSRKSVVLDYTAFLEELSVNELIPRREVITTLLGCVVKEKKSSDHYMRLHCPNTSIQEMQVEGTDSELLEDSEPIPELNSLGRPKQPFRFLSFMKQTYSPRPSKRSVQFSGELDSKKEDELFKA